ncbi:MAG TPA: carbohydrate-binding protein, partial [Puia sp.]|nr:carbohydrate-binding protein [Puia sp.]
QDVSYLNSLGNQVSYNVTVAAAGTYTATFRVSSPNNNATFKVMDGKNNVLATVTAPNTGGWQVWGAVSASVTLGAGSQTIKIVCQSANGFNFNWMQFVKSTTTAVVGNVASSDAANNISVKTSDSTATDQTARFNVYPNPAIDQVTLDIANSYMGRLDVQVIGMTGIVVKRYELSKSLTIMQTPISLSGLTPGMYIIRVSGIGWQMTKKVLKQ